MTILTKQFDLAVAEGQMHLAADIGKINTLWTRLMSASPRAQDEVKMMVSKVYELLVELDVYTDVNQRNWHMAQTTASEILKWMNTIASVLSIVDAGGPRGVNGTGDRIWRSI